MNNLLKTEVIFTLDIEDAVAKSSSDAGKSGFFWNVEEEVLCGETGDGFDFFNEFACVKVISYVITQNLGGKKSKIRIKFNLTHLLTQKWIY